MQVSRYVCPTDIQPWTAGPMDEHSGGGGVVPNDLLSYLYTLSLF